MSGGRNDSRLEAALQELAADLGPELLVEVIAGARRAAAARLEGRLTDALVAAMEQELLAPPPAQVTPLPVRAPAATGWYVYGITWAAAASAVEGSAGIDGSPIEIVSVGPLAAPVSPVGVAGSWGVGADGDVDLEALAPRARSHEAVLERLLDAGAVLPLRFGVVYPHLEPVRAALDTGREALEAELRRLGGASEWGLTLHLDPEPAGERSEGSGAASTVSSGRDYLTGRRNERQRAEARADEAASTAATIHRQLLEVAADAVVQPAAGRGGSTTVLRASYLVPGTAADAFRSRAEEQLVAAPSGLGLIGELTGPWPPYHFCDVSLEAASA